jgi:hypothetical protein
MLLIDVVILTADDWPLITDVAHLPTRRLDQRGQRAMLGAAHPIRRWDLDPQRAATCKPRQ